MKKRLLVLFCSLGVLVGVGVTCYVSADTSQTAVAIMDDTGKILVTEPDNNNIEETLSDNIAIEHWDTIAPQSESIETEPVFEEYDIKLMALGDNLLHMGLVNSGKQSDGSYNFDFLFTDIADYLAESDIKIINQETPLAGNSLGFSGYPLFNSPTEVGDAIAKAGFNVVLSATNHSADQGISGIDNIVSFWNTHPEVLLAGLHAPQEDTDTTNPRINLLEINDITFAILNYTYGPNYGSASKDLASRLDILCAYKEGSTALDFTTINPTVLTDIAEADALADIVIVCPHWGNEYALTPSAYQTTFAKQMTEAGADVIIGTHPHVPQPIETVTADNGNTSLCFYSLGNYVSTQKNGASMLEEMAWVVFHVTENDISVDFEKSGALPLVCHYLSGPLRYGAVYALEDYTEELASQHGIIRWGQISFHLSDLQNWNTLIIGDHALTKEEIFQ